MGTGFFIGLILIFIGFSVIIKIIFKIDFPIFRILFALFLIYLGVKMLIGKDWFHYSSTTRSYGSNYSWHHSATANDAIFKGQHFGSSINENQEFNIVFGKGVVDLTDVNFKDNKSLTVQVHTVFGGSEILLNKNIPVRITLNSAFAESVLPNGNTAVFGTSTFSSDTLDASKPYLDLRIDAVFGSAEIRYK